MWVVQQFGQFIWFADELLAVLKLAAASPHLPELHVHMYATKPSSAANPYAQHARNAGQARLVFFTGRPTVRAELGAAAESLKPSERLLTFVCGPSTMVNEVWDLATEMRQRNYNVGFHREMFEL